MVWKEQGVVVWVSFFAHFLLELFSITPFGIILASSTFAILATFWIFRDHITNKSLIGAVTLCLVGLLLYRVLYAILLLVGGAVFAYDTPSIVFLLNTFAWELLFTTLALVMMYGVINPFMQRTRLRSRRLAR